MRSRQRTAKARLSSGHVLSWVRKEEAESDDVPKEGRGKVIQGLVSTIRIFACYSNHMENHWEVVRTVLTSSDLHFRLTPYLLRIVETMY